MQSLQDHPFSQLTPDIIMDAVESQGLLSDGRFIALNSYENRVYQVGIDQETPIIAKFYRPERWSDAQILEDHEFSWQLSDKELPVVPPWRNSQGETLFEYNDFRFALYERKGGHAPELSNLDHLYVLGRLLGRIHSVGAIQAFQQRPTLDLESFGWASFKLVCEHIPASLHTAYSSLGRDILDLMRYKLDSYGHVDLIRVHGDCHTGNILWRDDHAHFVDLDDTRMAPAIQDLWMLLSGDQNEQKRQLQELLEGYNEFYDFDLRQLQLIEIYRTLRIMQHVAWIAKRWSDPAFPIAFSWFNSERFWSEHILTLREQFAALHEPSLTIYP
ncbi:MAG: serine/threonine protein kinase [Gammaproteobacteria bacterium]|jgi:Ser/Thr protein kinase RdoA (MazF antagonist)|nr:serine/threonine protein kinase [Gammaproteobacteria bacterium]MCP4879153.1 serine/threonine protein kinase [Gammaproteobacteria bacterium]MDP6165932.1 serine/threonine protein kinase [Gammaproteobacteria bacterium]